MSNTPPKPVPASSYSKYIHQGLQIGHVHFKVADLEHALGFYYRASGFELMQRYGHRTAFLSAGNCHLIGLNTRESQSARSNGASEALYVRDPDQNDVEPYWKHVEIKRPGHAEGRMAMFTRALAISEALPASPPTIVSNR